LIYFSELDSLRTLTRDGRWLFAVRTVRLFAYGFLSVVLALYLAEAGLSETQIGALFTATLIGDAIISLGIAGAADRGGRRRMLLVSAGLMIFAGVVLSADPAGFKNPKGLAILSLAAIVGVLSPSGNEVGPFLSIEQASLPQTAPDRHRTQIFAWYNLCGQAATALGALCGGGLAQALQGAGESPLNSYRVVVIGYALLGGLLAVFISRLSPTIEASAIVDRPIGFGLHRSRGVVFRLAALFAVDAFAGGLVVQSLIAYWFHVRFGVGAGLLGGIFFGANLFAAASSLAAARLAARFGLVNTMVWTHIPSNILLMLVPLMPDQWLAIAVLLARFAISQMDVPTRQSYTMAVVAPDERSAAAGVTSIARTLGSAASPALTGLLLGAAFFSAPFLVAGGLKIAYDLSLFYSFRRLKPAEEQATKR
jgi:MFS family permease